MPMAGLIHYLLKISLFDFDNENKNNLKIGELGEDLCVITGEVL